MLSFLPDNPRIRSGLGYLAALVGTLFVTQVVMPALSSTNEGTPVAILFAGFEQGLLLALIAAGVVMLYRSLRIINFAQGATGAVGSFFSILLIQFTEVPFLLAVLCGIAMSALLGASIGVFTLRFANASRLFLTVVTLVASTLFFRLFSFIQGLPIFPDATEITVSERQLSVEEFRNLLPFPGLRFTIGSFELVFGFPDLFAIELGIIGLLAIAAFFRFTRTGVAVRALAENAERSSLLGISVGSLTIIVWAVTGALAGVGVTAGLFVAGGTGGPPPSSYLLWVLGAAVMGRMTKFAPATAAAIAIGVLGSVWEFSFRSSIDAYNAVLFVVVVVGLLLQRRKTGRSEELDTSWSATEEPRPVPTELRGLAPVRAARYVVYGLLVIAAVLVPFIVSTQQAFLLGFAFLSAIAVLSLVVLTGWAGQVSLGQFALVAVGAVVAGSLTARAGVSFWIAVPVATALTGAVALLIGLPALRIRGLFLMVSTFGLAVAVEAVLFDPRFFGWLLPELIERPSLPFIDFDNQRNMYFLCLACLGLSVVVVNNLRRSRVGRLLIAMRENEANVQGFGISTVRLKLTAFAISGALCGFAGAVMAHLLGAVDEQTFIAQNSVGTFISAVVGGVSSPGGAMLGAAYSELQSRFFTTNLVMQTFFNSGGPLLILFLAPGGLISLVNAGRDSVLRVIAQRRQIVVPSLFADYDPDVLERRLIPLAEPDASSGLAALPHEQRFSLASELYQGTGERIIDRLGPARESADRVAIGAAARAVADFDEVGDATDAEGLEALASTTQKGSDS